MNKKLDPDGIHNWLFKSSNYKLYKYVINGIDEDDCAVLKVDKGEIIVTTDFLNSNPIVKELGIGSNYDLGRLLVAANVSDLCGTGANPIGFLSSLMFEKGTLEKDFKEFVRGILFELKKHNIPLVGGDTKLGKTNVFCGIALGISSPRQKVFTKNNAKVGDLIWVSDKIGSVAASITGLSKFRNSMTDKWNNWAVKTLCVPNLPVKKSKLIADMRIGKGGTDLSDGLCKNLWDLCEKSNVGAIIDANLIPLHYNTKRVAKALNISPWIFALNIGGDFQFIVTSNRKDKMKFENLGLIQIGEIINGTKKLLKIDDNKIVSLPELGHTDFKITNFADEVDKLLLNVSQRISDGKRYEAKRS